MDIIDEFRKKAEQQRRDLQQSQQSDTGLLELRAMKVVAAMQEIHNYLHDLIAQLNIVQPDFNVSMQMGTLGDFVELQQTGYRLSNESIINKEVIALTFTLKSNETIELELENSLENKEQCEELKSKGILVNYISRQPDNVSIQGYIPASIEFASDFSEANIHITINNFTRLASERYVLNVDTIDSKLLDELGRFILRRENNFTDVLIEDSQSISIVQRKDSNGKSSNVTLTEEMDISRLRSLFNREQRLYLTYQNVIKDVGSRNREFILGRAKDCDLTINSDLASRHHALLVYRKGKFVLVDQSTNGSFVKPQGGKETYVQGEELPLAGSGFISLGKAVTVDNEHLIYFSCQ